MVVLVLVVDPKPNNDPVQEPVFAILLTLGIEIFTGVENKLILAGKETRIFQQGRFTTAIRVGDGLFYGTGLSVAKKLDTDGGPGAAIGDIQYMCR